ncbi:MAG: hypothetical protein A4S09_13870 [Proteobacteria bacterium SG_bin7]|nr:MAG: hypothetical protein A4S09_13870 [Proteobacteria bacterium SG_bin7]
MQNFGNKARTLIELKNLGLRVPDFFVIPADKEFNDYRQQIQEFGHGKFAVRSSCSKEDGVSQSFAGLFETYLDVTAKGVEEAVKQCREAVRSDRVKSYCLKNEVVSDQLQMAVIVQEYVAPDFAGVAFGVNPITGDDREILVEMCRGSGEKLVSGKIRPTRYCLNTFGGQLIKSFEDAENLSLPENLLINLREAVWLIQSHYGKPQDIEFAFKNGELFILQSRDITRVQFAKSLGEWTTADFRDGGVSSAVVSPLIWSLYESIFATSLPNYFLKLGLIKKWKAQSTTWYKVFFGRPYWNLKAVKETQETLPGYNEGNFDRDMSIPATYEGDGVVTPISFLGILKAIPILWRLRREYKKQTLRSTELLKNFYKIENIYKKLDWSALGSDELLNAASQLILTDYKYVESEYFQTIYNASNAKLEFADELKYYKKYDPNLEYLHLISGLGDLRATKPIKELQQIAGQIRAQNSDGLERRLNLFFEEFYYHSERELDLRVPRWSEDSKFITQTLEALVKAGDRISPVVEDNFSKEFEKLKFSHKKSPRRFIPGSFRGIERKLNNLRNFLWLREELRDRSTRMYYFIRKLALEVGSRFNFYTDVFYLSHHDIIDLLSGKIDVKKAKDIIKDIKIYAKSFENYKNQNEIGARYSSLRPAKTKPVDGKKVLTGIGCSAGERCGRARVIRDISESQKLKPGEIMVVPFTDPGWTPLFGLASAVVTETGGLLSHAALISREYALPCVLNVEDATNIIPDGAEISVNGIDGSVVIL